MLRRPGVGPRPDAGDGWGWVDLVVPAEPTGNRDALLAFIREYGLAAALELSEHGRPGGSLVARILVSADGSPVRFPASDERTPPELDALASLAAAALGAGLILGDRVLDEHGAPLDEHDAQAAEEATERIGAGPTDLRALGAAAPAGEGAAVDAELLARRVSAPLRLLRDVPVGHGGTRHVLISGPGDDEQTGAIVVFGGGLALLRYEGARAVVVHKRGAELVHRWDRDHRVHDPSPAGWQLPDGTLVAAALESLRPEEEDPGPVMAALRIPEERGSEFRALWRERASTGTTFERFAELVGWPREVASALEAERIDDVGEPVTPWDWKATLQRMYREETAKQRKPAWWRRATGRRPALAWWLRGAWIVVAVAAIVRGAVFGLGWWSWTVPAVVLVLLVADLVVALLAREPGPSGDPGEAAP